MIIKHYLLCSILMLFFVNIWYLFRVKGHLFQTPRKKTLYFRWYLMRNPLIKIFRNTLINNEISSRLNIQSFN